MWPLLVVGALAARVLSAQVPMQAARPVEAITAAEIARHVGVMTHDSMQDRATPSRGLELTAQYIASQFRALGLRTIGDSHGLQRYALPGQASWNDDESTLMFVAKARRGANPIVEEQGEAVANVGWLSFATAAIMATDTVLDPRAPAAHGGGEGYSVGFMKFGGPAPVVVAGPHTLASVRDAKLHDKVVVYIPAAGADTALQRQLIGLLADSNHVIVVADEDSAHFAHRRAVVRAHPPVVLDWYLPAAEHLRRWVIYVWAPAIQSHLAVAGLSLAEARAASRPIVRALSAVARLRSQIRLPNAGATVPNAVGVVEGRDSSGEVIVVTAHMDRTGVRPSQADSIANGANDNASGVAGLLALAKAFKQAGARPRRSILFAAVSGGAKGWWGSTALLENWSNLGKPVLNINLDMIGRAPGDSLRIAGLGDVELSVRPAWLAAQHSELGLTVVDDGTAVKPESDHFAFVRKMVPSLYIHTGEHGTEPEDDTPAAVDAEQERRIVQLVFYLTQALANAPGAFGWTAEGRQQRLRTFGH